MPGVPASQKSVADFFNVKGKVQAVENQLDEIRGDAEEYLVCEDKLNKEYRQAAVARLQLQWRYYVELSEVCAVSEGCDTTRGTVSGCDTYQSIVSTDMEKIETLREEGGGSLKGAKTTKSDTNLNKNENNTHLPEWSLYWRQKLSKFQAKES